MTDPSIADRTHTAAAPQAGDASGLQSVALATVPHGSAGLAGQSEMPAPPWDAEAHDHDHRDLTTVAYTQAFDVDPFELAAVTWKGQGALIAWVRTRSDGSWSEWYELPHGDEHAPDPGSAEAAGTRAGTDPLIVPSSDAVQVRVDAPEDQVPSDIRLDLVDPGAEAVDAQAADPQADSGAPPDGAAASDTAPEPAESAPDIVGNSAAPRPWIRSRGQWGADESLREEPPSYGTVEGAFVHHTVSASSYTSAQVPSMIRSIYVYHVRGRGWNDIGYNFIVDRFGRVWEGRFGGVTRAVTGAHTLGYNDDAFAMSALGTYTGTQPSWSMVKAYQDLFAWKFTIHGVDPRFPVYYDGERWRAIAGHRDAASTACPGDALYARMAQITRGTITAMGLSPSRDLDKNGHADLLATSAGSLWFSGGQGSGGYATHRRLGTGWKSMNAIVMPGDWDGGRHDDLIARRASDGTLWLYPGVGDAGFGKAVLIGRGWNIMNMIVAPGDWDGDGYMDLIARRASDNTLWLFRGARGGVIGGSRQIGHGWGSVTALVGPGDWDGNNTPDLIARRSDGTLWLYPGVNKGQFGAARRIGSGWAGYLLTGAGDVNRDGHPDIVARAPNGSLVLYPGTGSGGFGRASALGTGWGGYNRLV